MSAPAPFPRTPSTGASTELTHCWCAECVRRRATWHGGEIAPATGGTITPPAPAEPSQPSRDRSGDILAALRAARRNALTSLEWIQHAIDQAEKARAGK